MNRVSKLFKPINIIPKNAVLKDTEITSKSLRLMLELGVIRHASPGNYYLLPLGVRALEKLTQLVDAQMQEIDAQKLILPTLTSAKLWGKSGRLEEATPELFQLQDRHNSTYILSPTHEEAITDLLSSVSPLSYKHFPIKLYQITSKYRDEMKTRFGLIRSRQFLMKDLYTFDVDEEKAKGTYETVSQAYEKIFEKIGVEFVKVVGATGIIGGSLSHEYHYISDIGEDKILLCNKCNYSGNTEVSGSEKCPQCENSDTISIKPGIEVGHTFLLGEKYSRPLQASFLAPNGKPSILQMGCFGLGLTRILAAAVEVLSHEYEIRWPTIFAPYKMVIIPPKAGSKEELHTSYLTEKLYHALDSLPSFKNDILLDDRSHTTIGKRFLESKRTGYPYIVAIGSKAVQDPPLFELNDLTNGSQFYFTEVELLNYVSENGCSKTNNDKDDKGRKPPTNLLVLNEVVVDRGPSPYLSNIDLFLDGKHITSVQGDGLIVSTPTGSTAYAVAAGASMIHPSVPAIMVTPICPHSLSFRPIVVPAGVELKISVSPDSRNISWVSFDGRNRQELLHGDSLRVTTSIYPVPSICAQDQITDWFDSLAECLHWNVRKRQKHLDELSDLTHSSSDDTLDSMEQADFEKDMLVGQF